MKREFNYGFLSERYAFEPSDVTKKVDNRHPWESENSELRFFWSSFNEIFELSKYVNLLKLSFNFHIKKTRF